jgi:hypothetical protein
MMVCSPGGRAPRFALIVARSAEALPLRTLMTTRRFLVGAAVVQALIVGALWVILKALLLTTGGA